jgi:hypothetical protein
LPSSPRSCTIGAFVRRRSVDDRLSRSR